MSKMSIFLVIIAIILLIITFSIYSVPKKSCNPSLDKSCAMATDITVFSNKR